jgi:glycosyltransferase involved in cell wall biosynthesis
VGQSLKPSEIIIIDDCSSDGSQKIIRSLVEKYSPLIIPYFNSENLGISACRNLALKNISGKYFTFLDGDDYFLPDKLADEYECITTNPDCKAVYSNFYYEDNRGNKVGQFATETDTPAEGYILKNVLKRNYNVSSGGNFIYEMMDTDCAKQIGGYNENCKLWEDWDFRIRFSNKFQFSYNPNISSVYRKIPNSLSGSNYIDHFNSQKTVVKNNNHIIHSLEINNKKEVILSINRKLERILRLHILEKVKNSQWFLVLINVIQLCYYYGIRRNLEYLKNEFYSRK